MSWISIVLIVVSVILAIGIVRVIVKDKNEIDNIFVEILLLDLFFDILSDIFENLDV